MTKKLTYEEISELRRYASRCCDLMNYASISPGVLIALLDGYKREDD